MKNRFISLYILGISLLLSTACVDREKLMLQQLPEGLHSQFSSYYYQKEYKAFAVGISEDDRWSFGSAYNARSQASADQWALKRCNFAKQRDGVDAVCRLFAQGTHFAGK